MKTVTERREHQKKTTVRWIADANIPLSMVERPSFRAMIASYDATAKPISSKTVKEEIIAMDGKIRREVIARMKGCTVNLTTDHWTSKQNLNYVGLTAHWIDHNWKLHSLPLGMFLHEGRTQATDCIDQFMVDVAREISKEATIFAVTTDTDATMNAFGQLLEEKHILHLYCTDHVFHLTCKLCYLKDSFGDDVEISAVQKATKIVSYFNQSTQALERIKTAQRSLQCYAGKEAKKPLTDVVTRWWSTYTMCLRIQYLKQALGSMLGGGDLPNDLEMSNADWNDLSSVIQVLEPFRNAQLFLEGEKYVSSSYVIPTVFLCRESLRKGQANTVPQSVRALSQTMNTDFETRWGKSTEPIFSGDVIRGNQNCQVGIHPAFVIATFLHPSLKLFKSIGVDEASKARVKEVVLDLMMQNVVVTDPQPAEAVNDNEDDGAITTVEDETPLARILRLNMETEDDVVGNQSDNNRKASFERELRDYKQWKGKIPHQGGYPDALEWWKLKESRFPNLDRLAKKNLSIQAT